MDVQGGGENRQRPARRRGGGRLSGGRRAVAAPADPAAPLGGALAAGAQTERPIATLALAASAPRWSVRSRRPLGDRRDQPPITCGGRRARGGGGNLTPDLRKVGCRAASGAGSRFSSQ